MAIIAGTGKLRNKIESLWRVADAAWFGRDVTTFEQAPDLLNGEFLISVNAAGTGTVNMLGVNASNQVVLPPAATILTAITASGAVPQHTAADYVITKAGIAVLTLAAPTVTTDDGVVIVITSATLFAHTLTATGLLGTGTASVNVATFAAFAGAGLTLIAFNGKWNVTASVGITFS